jgi:hypothetical protein
VLEGQERLWGGRRAGDGDGKGSAGGIWEGAPRTRNVGWDILREMTYGGGDGNVRGEVYDQL